MSKCVSCVINLNNLHICNHLLNHILQDQICNFGNKANRVKYLIADLEIQLFLYNIPCSNKVKIKFWMLISCKISSDPSLPIFTYRLNVFADIMRINKLLKDSRCSMRTAKRFPATQNTAINTSYCEHYLYSDSIMMLSVTNGFQQESERHHRAEPESTETQEAWGSLGINI